MCRIRAVQHFEFAIKFRDSFIIDPVGLVRRRTPALKLPAIPSQIPVSLLRSNISTKKKRHGWRGHSNLHSSSSLAAASPSSASSRSAASSSPSASSPPPSAPVSRAMSASSSTSLAFRPFRLPFLLFLPLAGAAGKSDSGISSTGVSSSLGLEGSSMGSSSMGSGVSTISSAGGSLSSLLREPRRF
ncbi:hypothetical protein AO1008_11904 [Aspergillus oryzae 100-8]|uniref:Uncharacterized protein n=1 Tax=Aspergillus oryzae (strain 3.042) TaxID=1160506 RepID=I7ZPE4_ASPO3|nr:hypothetical protein Ao3042_10554 [Aspergillus oryzae 3.042]KDE75584.1 hypothetical protein AO1008_11904 [Aspergillus oryzae 100-8]|eukprot:EIT73737.1 hypothetical protein Ao3042_10554 [Aspergillus oryzae 3.042]